MGVFKMFSSSSADKKISGSIGGFGALSYSKMGKGSRIIVENNLPNPNPNNFLIQRHREHEGNLMIEVKYLDCKNYEGEKILVYEKCTMKDLEKQKAIDPHFCENKNFHSPIARFEPTERGWRMAGDFLADLFFKYQ